MTNVEPDCFAVVESYIGSMLRGFTVLPRGVNRCLVVTPFRRPDGEAVELEVESQADGTLRLSDLGDSIAFLDVNGLTLSRNVMQDARRVCRRHQVELSRYELVAKADPSDSGERLHELIQATLMVSDLIQRRRPNERLQFGDIVETFLISNRAVYDSEFPVRGQVQEHTIRFHIDTGRHMLIQPIAAANEGAAFSWAERWAFRFGDIRRLDPTWQLFAVLDDRGERARAWTSRTFPPLQSQANVVLWSHNEELAGALAEAAAN